MVKKIMFISFLLLIMSCSAIGRGILIDSVLGNVHKELQKEKKQNSRSKPTTKENEDEDLETEEEEIEDEDTE
ncbi:hypothetical protein QIA37_00515 (plasmid) [Borrelia sp. CA_690]|uniref:Lipoprotein n=1 Tax=Borrelia maritima TaxID=2761123 RepID=A0A5J6WB65_9SPIR|nr:MULTISPECIES: hypothetical protein [Borrelia]QFI14994.1 hypothetical protein DB723_04510 [Borrelia maritima]WKC84001.1 hypothetical protein QIA37_00515 [Borrelia sp. CA_690]